MDRTMLQRKEEALRILLRQARKASGLRQVDVAERMGEPQSFVSKYESGERQLTFVELAEVCSVLGIPLSRLLADYEGAAHDA